MCIAFWTFEDPDYALILCSNRDEFLNRPTINARFHSFRHFEHHGTGHEAPPKILSDDSLNNNVLSGIDEVGGGTWFGMTRSGRVALLTNITEPPSNFASSRGSLVSSFLLSEDSIPDLEKLARNLYPREAKFAGFNLLLLAPNSTSTRRPCHTRPSATKDKSSSGDTNTLPAAETETPELDERDAHTDMPNSRSLYYSSLYVTNSGAGGPITARPLSSKEQQCGGLSNGIDAQGGSEWPKVIQGIKEMKKVIAGLPLANDAESSNRGDTSTESVTTTTTKRSSSSGQNDDDMDHDCEKETQDRHLADHLFEMLTWQSPEPVTERSHLRRTIHVHPIPINLKAKPASSTRTDSDTDSSINSHGTGARNQNTSVNADPEASLPTPSLLSEKIHQDLSSKSSSSPAVSTPIPARIPVPGSEKSLGDSTKANTIITPSTSSSFSSTPSQSQNNHDISTVTNTTSSLSASPSTSDSTHFYGTRLSTVLLIHRNGDVMFIERDIWKMINDEVVRMGKDSERVFRFRLDGY